MCPGPPGRCEGADENQPGTPQPAASLCSPRGNKLQKLNSSEGASIMQGQGHYTRAIAHVSISTVRKPGV